MDTTRAQEFLIFSENDKNDVNIFWIMCFENQLSLKNKTVIDAKCIAKVLFIYLFSHALVIFFGTFNSQLQKINTQNPNKKKSKIE